MPPKRKQPLESQDTQPYKKAPPGSQYLQSTLNFMRDSTYPTSPISSRTQMGKAGTHAPSAMYGQRFRNPPTQVQAAGISGIIDGTSRLRIDKSARSSKSAEGSSDQKFIPILYVDDDGDCVEIRGENSVKDDRGELSDLTPSGNSDSRGHLQPKKSTPPVAEGPLPLVGQARSSQTLDRRRNYSQASQPSAVPGNFIYRTFQVLDTPPSSNFSRGDFMTDAEFAQNLNWWPMPVIHDLTDEDEAVIEDPTFQEVITENLASLVISSPDKLPPASGGIATPRSAKWKINSFEHLGQNLQKGVVVELNSGTFLRIQSICQYFGGAVTLEGFRLERIEKERDDIASNDYWSKKLPDQRVNELVWINEVGNKEYQRGERSVLQEHRLAEVKKVRRVIFTNSAYSDVRFRHERQMNGWSTGCTSIDAASGRDNATLYCRWKYVQLNVKSNHDTEASIALLDEEEASEPGRSKSCELRRTWQGRGGLIRGGSSIDRIDDVDTEEVTSLQRYTLGDSFCGVGGISRGALQANLKVKWGFDSDANAIAAYRGNFGRNGTKCFRMSDAEIIDYYKEQSEDLEVDILHCSPPCQAFSPANPNLNPERDAVNQRALFSVFYLVEALKPRIVTVEETAGLLSRHREWFEALLNMFTNLEYSIRWKIVRCQDFGLPQTRVRLLVMAAAPGEKLPPFPRPTHGDVDLGLKPYVMKGDAIANIPASATHQDVISKTRNPELLKASDPNTFAKCITTSGGQGNVHPSGTRKYNNREFARLQGFPDHHTFSQGLMQSKKEIGNAVPPPLSEAWFKTIIRSLRETDSVEG